MIRFETWYISKLWSDGYISKVWYTIGTYLSYDTISDLVYIQVMIWFEAWYISKISYDLWLGINISFDTIGIYRSYDTIWDLVYT